MHRGVLPETQDMSRHHDLFPDNTGQDRLNARLTQGQGKYGEGPMTGL